MERKLVVLGMLLGFTSAAVKAKDAPAPANASVTVTASTTTTAATAKADAAIRELATTFVTAYNAHDAKALGKLFLPEAQVVNEDNSTLQGREKIQELFHGVFAENPQAKMEVVIDSIRFIGTALAIETGTSLTTLAPEKTPERGRYLVLHVLRDGKWSMGLVRDMPTEPTHREHLQSLAWLVGDWIDESRNGIVKTSCRWVDNGSFLLQEITVHPAGRGEMKVSQRIGWDPLTKQFKAWMFDEEGAYGESIWTPTESGWLIKMTSVQSDGTTTSATNSLEPISFDRYVFRSGDRVVGNQVLPPVEVNVVRQAPAPR